MKRVLRWMRQLIRREKAATPVIKAATPVIRSGLLYDPAFVRQSFRPGDRVNPIATTIEE